MKSTELLRKIKRFVKKEPVLCCALLLALLSAFWVHPDVQYIEYLDFRTLAILFCLMSVMAGLQKQGVFQWIAGRLLGRVRKLSRVVFLLVLLCFFSSMFITNDVALITFVPFTFTVGRLLGQERYRRMVFPVVVLQTVAANLGSMLTPVGNPQNLYLYGISGMSVVEFMGVMLPYSLLSLVLLSCCCAVLGLCLEKDSTDDAGVQSEERILGDVELRGPIVAMYLFFFFLCILTVLRIVPLWLSFAALAVGICVTDRKVFARVDYSLLLTFAGFFVFIGNMGRISVFADFLRGLVGGNEVWVSILASQCISNVPAALLLSGFTDQVRELIVGTNLGGLGTLIASMASLISYKYIAVESERSALPGGKGRYFLYFTLTNIGFLAALTILYVLERKCL